MARGRKVIPRPSAMADAASGDGETVQPPDGMTPRVLGKWNQLVPLIARMCPLRDTDADALRQYCEAFVLRERALAELEDGPLVLVTPNGARQTNPLLKIVGQQEAVILKLAERFGLDPASRRRLAIAATKSASPLLDFIKAGRDRRKPPAAQ